MPLASASSERMNTVGVGCRFRLPAVSEKLELRKPREGLVATRTGSSSEVFSLMSHQSTIFGASAGSIVHRYPLRSAAPCQLGRKRNFLSGQPKPLAKRASSSERARSTKKPVF